MSTSNESRRTKKYPVLNEENRPKLIEYTCAYTFRLPIIRMEFNVTDRIHTSFDFSLEMAIIVVCDLT